MEKSILSGGTNLVPKSFSSPKTVLKISLATTEKNLTVSNLCETKKKKYQILNLTLSMDGQQ
jgi:hypothetical protein